MSVASDLFVIGLDEQVSDQKFNPQGNSADHYFFTQPGRVNALRTIMFGSFEGSWERPTR